MMAKVYPVKALWRGVLEDIPRRRASFFLSSFFAPLVFWLMLGMATRFDKQELVRGSVGVVAVAAFGVISAGLLGSARRRKYRHIGRQRVVGLVHSIHYGVMLLSLATYSLRVAIDYAAGYTQLPFWIQPGLLALDGFSALAAAAWAPSSLPRSAEDDTLAARRGVRWFPWVMGLQGSLIGLGVFLGAWFMHNEVSWGGLFLVGLLSLGAMLFLAVSILGLYRFFVLALNPISPELQEKFGLRS